MPEQNPIHTILGELPKYITNGNFLQIQAVRDLVNTHISDELDSLPLVNLESMSPDESRQLGLLMTGLVGLGRQLTTTKEALPTDEANLLTKVLLLQLTISRSLD